MSRNVYEQGDLVRVSATFKDADGVLVDPTTVRFKVKLPDATVTTYTYGTDAELVRDGTGAYHVDVDVSTTGPWVYRYESTGTAQAAVEGRFHVKSEF